MIIIPAIDIIDGSCVRLQMGDYEKKKIYHTKPLEVAKQFADNGLTHIHIVDLDGAKRGHVVNYSIIESIARHTSLIIDVGGGLQSTKDFEIVFESGAGKATVGSLAAKNRELTLSLLQQWGGERLLLGSDCKHEKIAVSGWTETTDLDVVEFVMGYAKEGFSTVISTDISKDGMMRGPSFDLYNKLITATNHSPHPLHIIASGGVCTMEDLRGLSQMGLYGAIIGKALYEGAFDLSQLALFQESEASHVS